MGFDTAAKTDVDSVVPEEAGGMWFLKDALESEEVGFTVLELEPGAEGMEHDHSDDDQEEVYYVVEGSITVTVADESVELGPEEAIRLDAGETRQIENDGDERATLVLAGAPL
ncbi:cupin domain-containing protein [Halobacteria archaeon AArc-dxtr1]|nr:cupin domain-containing protein [Halobacteria archaeon AArc-dxtr1]